MLTVMWELRLTALQMLLEKHLQVEQAQLPCPPVRPSWQQARSPAQTRLQTGLPCLYPPYQDRSYIMRQPGGDRSGSLPSTAPRPPTGRPRYRWGGPVAVCPPRRDLGPDFRRDGRRLFPVRTTRDLLVTLRSGQAMGRTSQQTIAKE